LSSSLALFVGVSTLAPWTAMGEPARGAAGQELSGEPGDASEQAESITTDETAGQTATQTAGGARADQPDHPAGAAPKPRGNGFGRAISAPFRALARLFGGGKQKSAKRRQSPPSDTTARVQTTTSHVSAQGAASPGPAPIRDAGANSSEPTAEHPTTDKGAVVVRPNEVGAAAQLSKTFVPVIEGISRDPLTQGRALLEHGYVREAISQLSVAATTIEPGANLVEANNLLGLAYDREGMHKQAAECYQRALTVAPNDPVILANLGYSLYLANDMGGALRRLQQAVKLSPNLTVVHNNIGIVQARLGRYDDAFRSFARATNQYEAHLKLATIHEIDRRDRQALKHYEAALRLQPNTSAVLERLAALYERTGDRTKAESARRALGQPTNPQKTATGGG
jgi:Flp pilus assembly protein TadD